MNQIKLCLSHQKASLPRISVLPSALVLDQAQPEEEGGSRSLLVDLCLCLFFLWFFLALWTQPILTSSASLFVSLKLFPCFWFQLSATSASPERWHIYVGFFLCTPVLWHNNHGPPIPSTILPHSCSHQHTHTLLLCSFLKPRMRHSLHLSRKQVRWFSSMSQRVYTLTHTHLLLSCKVLILEEWKRNTRTLEWSSWWKQLAHFLFVCQRKAPFHLHFPRRCWRASSQSCSPNIEL